MARFLLLLHRPANTVSGTSPEDLRERVGRYRAWREEMTRAGKIVAGEKLADSGGSWLPEQPQGNNTQDVISGYFILQAADGDEARAIAGGCPHLDFGGSIEIRPIESA